jgi:hypothetical protein
MKLYTLSTFECQGYTTANWFFATSREEAERLTEEAVNKVKDARAKLERKNKLWEIMWADYNSDEEYNVLCKKHNIKIQPYNWNILKIKYRDEYNAYTKRREDTRKKIQSGLAWRLLCRIEYHYSVLDREELLNEPLQELKDRIVEIKANVVLPMIQTDGD